MIMNRKLGRKLMIVFAVALMSASVFTATAIVDNNFTENPMPYVAAIKTLDDYTYEYSAGSYREGDIIYHREELPGHMGIIVKDDNGNLVVREAHPTPEVPDADWGDKGGTGYTSIDKFYKRYDNKEVFILRVNVDAATAKSAADFAKTIKGPFSMNPFDEDGWYCSELVYESYKSVGIDLSSDDPQIPLWVSPKDIYENPQTEVLPDGPTPGPDPWEPGGAVNPVEDGGLIESGPMNITPSAFLGERSSFNPRLQLSPLLTLQPKFNNSHFVSPLKCLISNIHRWTVDLLVCKLFIRLFIQ